MVRKEDTHCENDTTAQGADESNKNTLTVELVVVEVLVVLGVCCCVVVVVVVVAGAPPPSQAQVTRAAQLQTCCDASKRSPAWQSIQAELGLPLEQ